MIDRHLIQSVMQDDILRFIVGRHHSFLINEEREECPTHHTLHASYSVKRLHSHDQNARRLELRAVFNSQLLSVGEGWMDRTLIFKSTKSHITTQSISVSVVDDTDNHSCDTDVLWKKAASVNIDH